MPDGLHARPAPRAARDDVEAREGAPQAHVVATYVLDDETADLSGSGYARPGGNATWLTWNLFHIKLVLAVRAAHADLYMYHQQVKVDAAADRCTRHAAAMTLIDHQTNVTVLLEASQWHLDAAAMLTTLVSRPSGAEAARETIGIALGVLGRWAWYGGSWLLLPLLLLFLPCPLPLVDHRPRW